MRHAARPVRARCSLGGYAPCVDDLCYGGGQTLCGLETDFDFCHHGFIPETCPDCADDDRDEWPEDYDEGEADSALIASPSAPSASATPLQPTGPS